MVRPVLSLASVCAPVLLLCMIGLVGCAEKDQVGESASSAVKSNKAESAPVELTISPIDKPALVPVSTWQAQLSALTDTASDAPELRYRDCLRVLNEWTTRVSPEDARLAIRSDLREIVVLLSSVDDPVSRRLFLNQLASRYLAVAGASDVGTVCAIVDWSVMFHSSKTAGYAQLRGVTEDLILLFTDRGPSGITLSGAGYYLPGRFTSIGFKETLRDDSDQVRHLCWALRVLANSPYPRQAEQILYLKEVRDSKVRSLPMNGADLELNRVAREWVESVRAQPPLPGEKFAEQLRLAVAQ